MMSERNGVTPGGDAAPGITPASGPRAELLEKLSEAAFQLIRVAELEAAGIRGGDGTWQGSEALRATLSGITDLAIALDDLDQEAAAARAGRPAVDVYRLSQPTPRQQDEASTARQVLRSIRTDGRHDAVTAE